MIEVYYGFGKGKTTASIGLGMRAVGAGLTVTLVQFLKDNKSSELNVLPFDIFKAPDSLPFNPDKSYQPWVDSALEYIKNCKSDVIILDEFLDIIGKYVTVDKAVELIKNLSNGEIVITGHREISEIFKISDYITLMEKIKHPYDKGVKARKGIEY
ncbi:MAG: cob(I)yrinic acid a,c-diamide adenosyltransferase [Eubacterium sp.]